MLKGYYLTLSALSLMAIGVAQAQDYDLKNTEALENPVGFSVLSMKSPIAVDQAERGRTAPLIATAPAVSAEEIAMVEPAAGGDVEVEYIIAPQSHPVQQDVILKEEQPVIKTQTIVGNTDTGVSPEEMAQYFDEMN